MSDPAAPPAVVLDASAAIALIRIEAHGPSIAALINSHSAASGRLLVPDHFWLEITNVLIRRHHASGEQAIVALQSMDELQIESIHLDRPQLLLAIDLQLRSGLSAYDAAYLALAQAEDARLLTLDARLAEAAGERAIRLDGLPPRRVMENPVAYGPEPLDWGRFGPYLAQLRAEARDRVRAPARD